MADGVEIRLYDLNRDPPQSTDVVLSSQCAVLLKDTATSVPLSREGNPFRTAGEITCTVFETIDSAYRFCQDMVAAGNPIASTWSPGASAVACCVLISSPCPASRMYTSRNSRCHAAGRDH